GEACDDGNRIETDACTSACVAARCGDGIQRQDLELGAEGYEACDDGNQINGDSCSNNCDNPLGSTSQNPGSHCKAILESGHSTGDGAYYIQPSDQSPVVRVFCDMETDGGGWTLAYKLNALTQDQYRTESLNRGALDSIQNTSLAKLSDAEINAIGATSFWNLCGRRQTIYRRNLNTSWYSNHGVNSSCSYNRGFWSGAKSDHAADWSTPSNTYQACGGAQWGGRGWGVLSGIFVGAGVHMGCYTGAQTTAAPEKYNAMPGAAASEWHQHGFVLIR
ncbi:MAG: fibrinogen-like YCDxxxxGGGW domain-containing protein, partial [Myxococcota bacterium]|nr:fibrinogen-like YCDxxxxGGGW domain-containing protein [Myxococcota bacterium]